MKGTKKVLKITGVAKQCVDCDDLIDKKSRLICETSRPNPDWKEGMSFMLKFKFYPQCVACGYDKYCYLNG